MNTFFRFRLSHWKHVIARTTVNIYNNQWKTNNFQAPLLQISTSFDLHKNSFQFEINKKIYEYRVYLLILLLVRSYEFFSENFF